MEFRAYQETVGVPNVVVDGAANAGTVLVLSHWPGSGTPAKYRADVSAEIVLNFLKSGDSAGADVVTNNHFDEDGLVGVFCLLQPEFALAHRTLLVDVAQAGDFVKSATKQGAQIAFAISAMAEQVKAGGSYLEQTAEKYRQLLPRLQKLVETPEAFKEFWEPEFEQYERGATAVQRGSVIIEEHPEVDAAVVRYLEGDCHPMAIHNGTEATALIGVRGKRVDLQYRYEGWVQFVSRKIHARRDLNAVAKRLTDLEDHAVWAFDGVDSISPRLYTKGDTSLEPEFVIGQMLHGLRTLPAAWDPFKS